MEATGVPVLVLPLGEEEVFAMGVAPKKGVCPVVSFPEEGEGGSGLKGKLDSPPLRGEIGRVEFIPLKGAGEEERGLKELGA